MLPVLIVSVSNLGLEVIYIMSMRYSACLANNCLMSVNTIKSQCIEYIVAKNNRKRVCDMGASTKIVNQTKKRASMR